MNIIITISGDNGIGKTNLANRIAEYCLEVSDDLDTDIDISQFSYANAVKKAYNIVFPPVYWDNRQEKEANRNNLIAFAEKIKELNPYVWANIVHDKIENDIKTQDGNSEIDNVYIIDDLRFDVEEETLNELCDKYGVVSVKIKIMTPRIGKIVIYYNLQELSPFLNLEVKDIKLDDRYEIIELLKHIYKTHDKHTTIK